MLRSVGLRLSVGCGFAIVASAFAPAVGFGSGHEPVVLRGEIVRDTSLKRKRVYVLQGRVEVASGATLTIRGGVTVQCDQGSMLVISQGGNLRVDGTADRPVVFTSAQPVAERHRGDWGGIVVNGKAPVNAPGGGATGADGGGAYGGYDVEDSSGSIRHLRVEYAGFPNGPESRSAALSLRGVGSATVVDSVEALNGDGDGVEVRGGSVEVRRVASIGNARGGFAFSEGWTGSAQFLLAQQRGDVTTSYVGLRCASSTPRVSNVTIVGGEGGIRFDAGARGAYDRVVVAGCAVYSVVGRDGANAADIRRGDLALTNLVVDGPRDGIDSDLRDALAERGDQVLDADAGMLNPFDEAAPDFRLRATSPALDRGLATAPSMEFAPYSGAFDTEATEAWTLGWSSFETPPTPRYLANSARDPETLARSFLDALAVGDVVGMKRLRITKNEFCWYVWPELPASHLPNVTCDFAWSQATLNSLAGLADVLSQYSGRRFSLVSVRFAQGSQEYPSYAVHGDTRLTVRDETGAEYELKLFGSMLEADGRFKLFSFVVD